ncbi:MAG TPA: TadE/TadG family type IV pilus assembly protein [Devosiaceae bacterium]|jgi:Flp pilus assembly protein TadG|nr:TadE/TadG family type IV pilus assembly protein [Devosiaceae bacterium]
MARHPAHHRRHPPAGRSGRRSDSGAAALEFAILAPVFILLGSGMLAYAVYFGAAHSVQQLAADAARTSIAGLSADERRTLVNRFLDANADNYVFITRANLSAALSSETTDPNEYSVALSYDATSLPIWNLYLPLPLPSRTITYVSVIRLGGS